MSHTKQYKDYNLNIIVNKKLKNSYISINRESCVTIKTPYNSEHFVETLLLERSSWIEKQLAKIESMETIKEHALYSEDFLKERVHYYSKIMQLEFKELRLKKMKSRWGSCSSARVITLNKELTKVKSELIDYVVVHELAHLVHMNHSKAFHSLVEVYLPNAKSLRSELKRIRLF